MQRFLRDVAAFGLLQLAIGAAWWTWHRPFSEDYIAATIDKHERLERAQPPRLILIGGSAAAFGFDSRSIEERLALTPVNMGLHFSLGAGFMLREVRADLKPGDVVVVALEYGQFGAGTSAGAVLDALGHRPASYRYVDGRLLRQLSDRLLPYLATQLRIDLQRATGRLRAPAVPYRRAAFDGYGDVVAHWDHPPPRQNLEFVLGDVTSSSIRDVSSQIGDLARFAGSRGARVFFSFPPIPADACATFAGELDQIVASSQEISGVQRLEAPGSGCYPRRLFYDTYYHLNHDGARRRSEELVAALLARGVAPRHSSQ